MALHLVIESPLDGGIRTLWLFSQDWFVDVVIWF